ncbi:MAG: AarF/UbiB family protein [Bdellovibrionales bacterium]
MINKFLSNFLICNLTTLLFSVGSSAQQGVKKQPQVHDEIRTEISKYIEANSQGIVPRENAITIYQVLDEILLELSRAQKMENPERKNWKYSIHLVQSNAVNAFMVPFLSEDYSKTGTDIYIFSGLIERLSRETNLFHLTNMLAGVIAHEIAHLLDKTDKTFKIENHYKFAHQAIEIRTDLPAQIYARNAGFLESGLSDALEKINDVELNRKFTDIAKVGIQTHPSSFFRSAALDMQQTYMRSKIGSSTSDPADLLSRLPEKDFFRELNLLVPNKLTFSPPTSFRNAVDQLTSILKDPRDFVKNETNFLEPTKFYFNALVLWIDQWLYQHQEEGKDITDYQRRYFRKYLNLLYRNTESIVSYHHRVNTLWHELLLYPEEIKSYHLREQLPSYNGERHSHLYYLDKIAIFSSEETIKYWLRTQELLRNPKYGLGISSHEWYNQVEDLRLVMSGKSIIRNFSHHFINSLEVSGLLEKGLEYSSGIHSRNISKGHKMPPAFTAELIQLSFNEYFKELPKNRQMLWLIMPKQDAYYPIPKYDNRGLVIGGSSTWNHTEEDRETKRRLRNFWLEAKIRAKHGDPVSIRYMEKLTNYMEYFWNLRGPMALSELVSNYSLVDWKWLFEFFDIRPNLGYQAIREDLSNFLKSKKNYSTPVKGFGPLDIAKKVIKHDLQGWEVKAPWMNRSIANQILDFSAEGSELRLKAFASPVYNNFPSLYEEKYIRSLSEKLKTFNLDSTDSSNSEKFDKIRSEINNELVNRNTSPLWKEYRRKLLIMEISTILESTISNSAKVEIISRELYPFGKQIDRLDYELIRKFFREFQALEIFGSTVEFIETEIRKIINNDKNRSTFNSSGELYTAQMQLIAKFAPFLELDITTNSNSPEGLKKSQQLALKASEFFNFKYEIPDSTLGKKSRDLDILLGEGNKRIRSLKEKITLIFSDSNLPLDMLKTIFSNLTTNRSYTFTDKFFETYIYNSIASDYEYKLKILDSSRLTSNYLKSKLFEEVVRDRIRYMDDISPEFLKTMNGELIRFLPGSSFEKDQMLERLAWSLDLKGSDLRAYIEEHKSYNWRKINPYLINLGSIGIEIITQLNYHERLALIAHVREPESIAFPKEVHFRILRILEQMDKGKPDYEKLSVEKKNKLKETREIRSNQFVESFSSYILDSRFIEKIPLLVLLLDKGKDNILQRNDSLQKLDRSFLGYGVATNKFLALETYLEVIDPKEKATSLAFLLGQNDLNSENYLKVFEAFNSVGKKFAQFASTWNLFGKEKSRLLKASKSKSQPMTKYEIEKTLKKGLSDREFSQIDRFIKVLGSASMKTAVLVRLKTGEELVLLVQSGEIERQIKSDLAIFKGVTEGLRRKGVSSSSSMFELIIETMEEQLLEEVDLRRETEKNLKAGELFRLVEGELRMRGWRFHVPQQNPRFEPKANILALDRAFGVEFPELRISEQKEVGKILVAAKLKMLFKYGWFDADRHTGNWLIDVPKKIIYPIDFGELDSFIKTKATEKEPRSLIFEFIIAVARKDSRRVAQLSLQMGQQSGNLKKEKLIQDLNRIYSKSNSWFQIPVEAEYLLNLITNKKQKGRLSDRLIQTIEILGENSIVLDKKYSFSAIKGLILLLGEKYVSPTEFSKLFITEALKHKIRPTQSPNKSCKNLY